MSETLSPRSRKSNKSTCRKCNRTVVVIEIEGRTVEVDPEIINTVPIDGAPAFVMSRRAHADLCERYKIETERAKLRAEQRAFKPRTLIVPRKRSGPGT